MGCQQSSCIGNGQEEQRNEATTTDFQHWKDAKEKDCGGRSSLEQQVELASQLWKEATLPSLENSSAFFRHTHSPELIIESLKQTPIQGSDSLVSWKGFQVGWFLKIFCKTPYMQKLIEFGCELWFVRKVCIIEIIRQAHCAMHNLEEVPALSGPFVGFVDTILSGLGLEGDAKEIVSTPTTFISYTGGYTLQETLDVLEQLDPKEYIWMDIFCVNQFAWTGKSKSPEMKEFKEGFLDDLQGQIRSIGKTALILEQWDNVMRTLEQIWVLWEIFNTADADVELEVLLPHGQTQNFVNTCLESREKFDTIMTSLASVDANKAKAEDDDDRAKIFARIQQTGVSKVNNLATSAMRGWMQKQGMARLEEQKQGGGEGPSPLFLQNLGKLLQDQGKLEDAEPLYRLALEKNQKLLGRDHPGTLASLNNLASLLKDQGKQEEAEPLFRRALEKQQNVLGPNHPHTLVTLNNFAMLLKEQGKLEEAEPLFRLAFEKQQKLLGLDHPHTLISLNGLADLLQDQGRLDEAEPLFRLALGMIQQSLGPDHPNTLISISNLALLLQDQGKLEEAEPLYRLALEKGQKLLGPDHPHTLTSLNNLASLLRDQGKLEEAEPLYRLALEKRQKLLGPDHTDTIGSINNLALLLKEQVKLEEAEPLFQQAVEKQQKLLGPDHPSTLICISNMALLLHAQGKLDEAEPLFRLALEKQQKLLGPDHPHTLTFINNLALLLQDQGKLKEAEPLYQHVLERKRQILGPDHPDTLISVHNLACLLYCQGNTAEAKILLRDCLERCHRVLGKDHPYTTQFQQAWNYLFGGKDRD